MSAPTPAETQAAVAKLHAHWCELTKREEPLRFYERAWYDLLNAPEYAGDAEKLWTDIQRLVRYLVRGISDGKRNAGCLKLRNFLAPDTFLADLAEARVLMRERKERWKGHVPAPDAKPMTEDEGREVAARLKKFREEGLKAS